MKAVGKGTMSNENRANSNSVLAKIQLRFFAAAASAAFRSVDKPHNNIVEYNAQYFHVHLLQSRKFKMTKVSEAVQTEKSGQTNNVTIIVKQHDDLCFCTA